MSQTLPLIALGGALGSVLRYLMVAAIGAPWGTAAVNVLGSFAIGALFVLLDTRTGWQLFLMTGVLGGFTTFSTFEYENHALLEDGLWLTAAANVALSLFVGLLAVRLGIVAAKAWL